MNRHSETKELRTFGLLVGGVFGLIGVWPLLFRGEGLRLWALALAGPLIGLGLVLPHSLKHVHKGWMWVGHILGWVNTRILLGIIFFGLLTPMGVVMRLFGRDAMQLALDQRSGSYRVVRKPRPRLHMRQQF